MDAKHLYELIDAQPFANNRDGQPDDAAPELEPLTKALEEDAELAQVVRRSARFDALLSNAFQDVPAPVGLHDRLLAAVLAEVEVAEETEEIAPAAAVVPRSSDSSTRWTRRVLLLGGAASAVALTCLAIWFATPPTMEVGELVDRVAMTGGWHDQSRQLEDSTWNTAIAQAPADHPLDAQAISSARAWRPFSTQLDRQAVEYDLRSVTTQPRAELFVLDCGGRISGLGAAAPHAPQSTTGNLVVAAWSRGNLVYVLALEGNQERYNRLIRLPQLSQLPSESMQLALARR